MKSRVKLRVPTHARGEGEASMARIELCDMNAAALGASALYLRQVIVRGEP